jgi:ABC-type multidrug transport system ATPase subunit
MPGCAGPIIFPMNDYTAAMPHVLSIEHLTVAHEGETVLDDLSLRIDAGRVHGIVGEPGAGKTTLLDAIFGFVRVERGAVTLDGTLLRPEDIGYLPADLYFYPGTTGREYLRTICMNSTNGDVLRDTARALARLTERDVDAQNAFRTFDIDAWARLFGVPLDDAADGGSADVQRKLGILGVLALARPVLLLDEPTGTLDVETSQLLGRVLRLLADSGRTVVVTSHSREALNAMCDAVHVLADGRIEAGPPV